MGVLAPGVGHPAFGNNRPKVWIRQHIDPRRRCGLAGFQGDDVFAAIGGEPAQAIAQHQIMARQPGERP